MPRKHQLVEWRYLIVAETEEGGVGGEGGGCDASGLGPLAGEVVVDGAGADVDEADGGGLAGGGDEEELGGGVEAEAVDAGHEVGDGEQRLGLPRLERRRRLVDVHDAAARTERQYVCFANHKTGIW